MSAELVAQSGLVGACWLCPGERVPAPSLLRVARTGCEGVAAPTDLAEQANNRRTLGK